MTDVSLKLDQDVPKNADTSSILQWLSLPQNLFIILGSFFGLLYFLLIPPFQVPDEYNHFYRAYQISEGGILPIKQGAESGGFLPRSMVTTVKTVIADVPFNADEKVNPDWIFNTLGLSLNPSDRVFINFPNTALYSPAPYLPQTLSYLITKPLGASPLLMMYIGRLFSLVVAIILIHFAIKIIPIFKWVLLLIVLTPMSLNQMASLSADTMTNSLAILFTAIVLRLALDEQRRIERKDLIILFVLTVLLALCKQTYVVLSLLYFLIPMRKIGSPKKYWTIGVCLFISGVLALVIWAIIILPTYSMQSFDTNAEVDRASPSEQLKFILANPFKFIWVVVSDYLFFGARYANEFIGVLGWLDTQLPLAMAILYGLTILIVSVGSKSDDYNISLRNKLIFAGVFVLSLFSISGIAYLSWRPVGADAIFLQGRYFIPIALLLFLLLYNKRFKFKLVSSYPVLNAVFFFVIIHAVTLFTVVNRYYIS
jgi:uncharacterized membrane protein